MPQITDLKPQKKLRNGEPRFNIYLDGKFSFALPAESLVKAGLKINQELSEKEIEKLVKENEYDKFFNLVLRFLSVRPRSEKEIKDWFKKKEVGESVQFMVWQKLIDLGYINDEEFVKWWLEQRQAFKPKGKRAIEMELRQKGISQELVSSIKYEVSSKDEIEFAKKAVEKKLKHWEKLVPEEFRQKLTGFLARRGFTWETIKTTIDETLGKE